MFYLRNYIYKEHIESSNINTENKLINLYIDFKANIPNIHKKELGVFLDQKQSLELALRKTLDSVVRFIDFHFKQFPNINIIFFMDFGEYTYHKNILREYKSNRIISGNVYSKEQYKRMGYNINYILKAVIEFIKPIPNVYIIELNNCESDFVPHFLIKHKLTLFDKYSYEDIINLIVSSDKDLLQSLHFTNTYQITQSNSKVLEIYDNNTWPEYMIKTDSYNSIDSSYVPLVLAIGGDKSDNIPNIKGVGIKSIIKFIYRHYRDSKYKSFDEFKKQLILNKYTTANDTKIAKRILDNIDIIERNLKLTSFDILEQNISINTKEQLYKFMNKQSIYTPQSFDESVKTLIHKDAKFENILNKLKEYV